MTSLREYKYETQLRMVWPEHLLSSPPHVLLPSGYSLRTYQPGDETRFFKVMEQDIHLYTEDFRLAALKTYLKLGYIPILYSPEMPERWRAICAHLLWPFTPEKWKS